MKKEFEAGAFAVIVKMAYGSTSEFMVEDSDSISNLKSLIQERHSLRRSSQLLRLTQGGDYLDDKKTMAEYGVTADPLTYFYFANVLVCWQSVLCFVIYQSHVV